MAKAKKAAKQASRDKNVSQGENYIVLTFSSIEAKESFLDQLGHEVDDRYIKGEILANKLFPNDNNNEENNNEETQEETGEETQTD